MNLPPLGQTEDDTEGQVVVYVHGLARESRDAAYPWESVVERNNHLYTYGTDTPAEALGDSVVVNDIQNAIIAATDIQTKEPPRVTLDPVETGEQPTYWWAGPDHIGIQIGLMPQQVGEWIDPEKVATAIEEGKNPAEVTPQAPLPIDPLQAGDLKAVAVASELNPSLMEGSIRPEWLVEFTDRLVAELYQQVFDVLWERSQVDLWNRKNLLDTNIQGWAYGLYEFDDERKRHKLRHLPLFDTYVDPTVSDIADASYAGFDVVVDAGEAAVAYPELADIIEAEANTGHARHPDGFGGSAQYDHRFERKVVVFRHFWLRHQQLPMSPDEAQTAGLVEQQPSPVDLDGTPLGEPSFIHAETGLPTAPGAPEWPHKIGIRQILILNNRVLDDRESEFADIPILHNVNIPLPGARPYGIGEPFRLRSLQRAASNVLDAMVEYADYFAAPVMTISQSMYNALPENKRDTIGKAGSILILLDDQWMLTGGKPITTTPPPPMPPALAELYPTLKREMEESSGHSEVLQGRAGSQARSGKAIELLQTSAASMIGFKSARTGDMVKRQAELMLHSIVHRLTVEDIERIISKYPRHILMAVHERAREIEWNVRVSVQAGNGSLQQQKRQLAAMDLQLQAISMEAYREEVGIDHRLEEERIQLQLQKQAAQAATGMAPAGEEAPPPEPGAQ